MTTINPTLPSFLLSWLKSKNGGLNTYVRGQRPYQAKHSIFYEINEGQLISKADFKVFIWITKMNENIFVFLP
jgi:hypothetical protein